MENLTGTEISAVIDGMKIHTSDRVMMSIMLHDVVFDNQKAIFDLVFLGHTRPASALLRVIFEAHVKGVWLYSCATEEQVFQFKQDRVKSISNPKRDITINEIVSAIETRMPHLNGTLSGFKERYWKGLNCLTHSGTMQFSYEFIDDEMKGQYSSDYSKSLLDFSDRFAISSLGYVGKIVGCEKIIKCSLKLSKERFGLEI